jgi:hypothetical protein
MKFFRFYKSFGIYVLGGKKNTSFKSGSAYENKVYDVLRKRFTDVSEPAGASSKCDITVNGCVNIEIKNKGAFEGGSVKLVPSEKGMIIEKDCVHKYILGSKIIYDGEILPWSEGKRSMSDWRLKRKIFMNDIYIDAPRDSISMYYRSKKVDYIQIEGLGLYCVDKDVLNLNVPKFECDVKLRIRCTKHMKNGISTDITAALQFDRKSLKKSNVSFDEAQ